MNSTLIRYVSNITLWKKGERVSLGHKKTDKECSFAAEYTVIPWVISIIGRHCDHLWCMVIAN